jgi:hypothetical protein
MKSQYLLSQGVTTGEGGVRSGKDGGKASGPSAMLGPDTNYDVLLSGSAPAPPPRTAPERASHR